MLTITDQARTPGIPEPQVVETILVADAPIHRLLEPEEVAAYIVFLCSDAASGVTGAPSRWIAAGRRTDFPV